MHKGFIKIAAITAALAVMLGAFGAHGLRPFLSDKELLTFETAVRYQFYHSFALLITGILFKDFQQRFLRLSGRFFCYGIVVFSGSLYLLTFMKLLGKQGFEWLGAITPFGGICFLAGWCFMLLAVVRKN